MQYDMLETSSCLCFYKLFYTVWERYNSYFEVCLDLDDLFDDSLILPICTNYQLYPWFHHHVLCGAFHVP